MKDIKCTNHVVKGTALPRKQLQNTIQTTIDQSLKKLSAAEEAFNNESYIEAVSAWSSLRDKGLITKLTQYAAAEYKDEFRPVQRDLFNMLSHHVEHIMNQNPTMCRVKFVEKLLESLYLAVSLPCWNQ
ncbi:MAG: hypothetical protein KDK64_07020 [Chlamydiia bacterium]|nr:hypothetical protein [Chlamydiia bacterium]